MKPKISIIVPVYNVESYIKKCLDSLINQTYKNIEIIIINDGSTDNSLKIINDNYFDNEKVFIFNKVNGGLSSARNLGLEKVTGQYLLFVDSDDWLELGCLSELVEVVKKENSEIVEFGYKMVTDRKILKEVKFNRKNIKTNEKILEEFFYGIQITDIVTNKLYKKDLFDGIRFVEGKIHEDYMVMPHLLFKCRKISIINNVFYNYYQRENSITQKQFTEKNLDRIFAANYVVEFCKLNIPKFYDISLVKSGFIFIYLYKQLRASKIIEKRDYIKYRDLIIREFNKVYEKVYNSKCLKRLPFVKRMFFKMFRLNKTLTIILYKLFRS